MTKMIPSTPRLLRWRITDGIPVLAEILKLCAAAKLARLCRRESHATPELYELPLVLSWTKRTASISLGRQRILTQHSQNQLWLMDPRSKLVEAGKWY